MPQISIELNAFITFINSISTIMPQSPAELVAYITALGMLLLGGGGLSSYIKQRKDIKNGVRQENRADTDSLNVRAVAMLETQFNYLVKPLEIRISTLTSEVSLLEAEVKSLEKEVKAHRTLYLIAVDHIRTLYSWISRHIPTDVYEGTEIPKPPEQIVGDLNSVS